MIYAKLNYTYYSTRNYLQVSDECVNYTASQVWSKFTVVLMIPLRNLFITVARTASN